MSIYGYLSGTDSQRGIVLDFEGQDKVDINNSGSTDIYKLRNRAAINDYTRVHVTPNYFRQPVRHDLTPFRCLVNLVTDADENAKVLECMARLIGSYRGSILNHPKKIQQTTRDVVALRCSQIPTLRVPSVVKFRGSISEITLDKLTSSRKLNFPAIIREAGTHTGQTVRLVHDAGEALRHVRPSQVYYLTEFFDYKSEDGLYRKYRVFVVGSSIILRHMLVSPKWSVHAETRDSFMLQRPDLIAEETALFENGLSNHVTNTIQQIKEILGLDFFGIDFGLQGRTMVLFEANATMNFFPFSEKHEFNYVRACLAPAQQAFDVLLKQATG